MELKTKTNNVGVGELSGIPRSGFNPELIVWLVDFNPKCSAAGKYFLFVGIVGVRQQFLWVVMNNFHN